MPRGVPASGKRNTKKSTEEIKRIAANAAKAAPKKQPEPPPRDPEYDAAFESYKGRVETAQAALTLPLIVPAPVGTFILHIMRPEEGATKITANMHVCTHFERFPDRLVPRGMIGIGDNVIEAAVLHPGGYVSGSPSIPITFETIEMFLASAKERHLAKTPTKPEGQTVRGHVRTGRPAPAAEEEEDLIV